MNRGVGPPPHPFVDEPSVAMRDEAADATYVLVIRGELDERYGLHFDGMRMERTSGTTVLIGPVRDQAQLYGLIERIEELGLELLSAQQLAASPPGFGRERS